jgi:hypothetical protein
MKKTVIFVVALSLTLTLLTATPAKAHYHYFWPGFAAGIGAGIILDSFFYHPRYYYPAPAPNYSYPPPSSYPEPYYDRWIPGHWERRYDPYYGYVRRFWIPGHWE